MTSAILVVDLGGTRLRVALMTDDGTLFDKAVIPTPLDRPAALAQAMEACVARSSLEIRGAVVGVAGPINYETGEALRLPNLPGWEPHVAAQRLSSQIGLPVLLANDADLAALGEHRFGAGRGTQDMLYMTSSTGVGAGVILNGRLLHGRFSLAEAGHTIIERSSGATVEQLGSGTALARIAGMPGHEVTELARAGEQQALEALHEVAGAFALGVFNLVHCFMPERVVIGGGVSRAGDLLLDPIRARLDSCPGCSARSVDVVAATGGDDVGLLGAGAHWQDSM